MFEIIGMIVILFSGSILTFIGIGMFIYIPQVITMTYFHAIMSTFVALLGIAILLYSFNHIQIKIT